MAFSYGLRRSSATVPVAIRSLRSTCERGGFMSVLDAENRTLGRRLLLGALFPPFRRFSSDKSPSVVGSPTQTVAANGTSDKSLQDGLPFDYIECEPGAVTLMRKSKDEIVSVDGSQLHWNKYYYEVEDEADRDVRRLFMDVKLFYGEHFNKIMEFDVQVFPDDHDRIAVPSATISVEPVSGGNGARHLEELEDFFKRRGIDHENLNFLFSFLQKRKEMDEECSTIGRKVHGKA